MIEVEFFDYSNLTEGDHKFIDNILFNDQRIDRQFNQLNQVYCSPDQPILSYRDANDLDAKTISQNNLYINNENQYIQPYNRPIIYYSVNKAMDTNAQFIQVNYLPIATPSISLCYENANHEAVQSSMGNNCQEFITSGNSEVILTKNFSEANTNKLSSTNYNNFNTPNMNNFITTNNDSYCSAANTGNFSTANTNNFIAGDNLRAPSTKNFSTSSNFNSDTFIACNVTRGMKPLPKTDAEASTEKVFRNNKDSNDKVRMAYEYSNQHKNVNIVNGSDDINIPNINNSIVNELSPTQRRKNITSNNNKCTSKIKDIKLVITNIDGDNLSENEAKFSIKSVNNINLIDKETGIASETDIADIDIPADEPKVKSWASVLMTLPTNEGGLTTAVARLQPRKLSQSSSSSANVCKNNGATREKDTDSKLLARLADAIRSHKLVHRSVYLQPRGLNNRGNWCYVNATLQALLMCPPLYNALSSLPIFEASFYERKKLPLLRAMLKFFHEFQPIDNRIVIKNTGKSNTIDIKYGTPFEPEYIYKMLQIIDNKAFKLNQQEDAEEFLSCWLNRLHDEFVLALKNDSDDISPSNNQLIKNNEINNGSASLNNGGLENGDENGDLRWEQVRSKNKSAFSCHVAGESSMISDIFRGQICCVLQRSGQKESNMLQPFFTLQLDVQNDKIESLQDALERLVLKESLAGYTCATSKTEVDASQRMFLDELPPVLVLHLKWFVYDRTGGLQKCSKQIGFNMELEINKDILSVHAKSKYSHVNHRRYTLFAVVNHIGARAVGGHYTVDVFHSGFGCWLRCDDNKITTVAASNVTRMIPNRVPYLIFYRRAVDSTNS